VLRELSQAGVVAIRADWTNSDNKITDALVDYDRIGIPLNVVLGPNLREPIILSEWLTIDEVVNAISRAKY
jgi:thiol:disulfide interchange protein